MVGGFKPLSLAPLDLSITDARLPRPPTPEEDTPRPPTPGRGPLTSHPTPITSTFPADVHSSASKDGSSSPSSSPTRDGASTFSPTSPSSRRPSSVRKFLGFRSMSSSDSLRSERPGSPSTIDSKPSLSRKKSGSWFGRRKSTFVIGSVPEGKENQTPTVNGRAISKPLAAPVRKGPPPPALPELKTFGVSDESSSLGADDMFKNIK
ncbi:hypothetical protein P154DRAFT_576356 [Amniculicola lignicola CBS 123094]|uniref:Uncharacterized protein n=1 Tax=Amniculicola lignicola CBS 123094 TaxID=1392246 RepID=A0A6A5WEH6_9PLEO|nr:hypothetical protein P154DRAFT_576356 [Amniculicola lignicola CBS 123094]